jgi:3-oxoacyl-[acyl-carrier-protein] synthase-1
MSASVAILNTGLVTSVGLSAPTACAAIRAGLTNPSQTHFIDSNGEWIMAHQVPIEKPRAGRTRLARLAAMSIKECLGAVPRTEWARIPLILCVAEQERPGRLDDLDDHLFHSIEQELDAHFAPESNIVAHGRVSVAIALAQARRRLYEGNFPQVLIAATDSLLTWPMLSAYEQHERLLTAANSNGFMPGEGSGALLVGRAEGGSRLACVGIGFGLEHAHIGSGQPLRGDGLTRAIREALADGGCEMHDMDFRISDVSGEQYYFKEASLALSRTLRRRKAEFDIWHPAECIGESGAVIGISMIALADAACRKGFSKGPRMIVHMANDAGQRAALAIQGGNPE